MKKNTTKEPDSKDVVLFLKSHPAISVRRLEETLGIPLTTISGALAKRKKKKDRRKIPKKYLKLIVKELEKYGFINQNKL